MQTIIKVIIESISQAVQQLVGNKLRSFLSLLGITIGIFCIIGVFSAVDSLENNIRKSIAKLGEEVIYIQKFSWGEDPGENYFKWMRRPNINYADYEGVKKRMKNADVVGYWMGIGSKIVKYGNNSIEGAYTQAYSEECNDLFNLNYSAGRFFSPSEYNFGANKVILGFNSAEELFGPIDPIGKIIRLSGRNLEVIGVLEKSGESIINVMNFDDIVIISYPLARKIANLNELEDNLIAAMRAQRRLRPIEEDDFSLNQLSIISKFLNGFFDALNILGIFLGGFATLVGMFSVANIMFVSVKERTRIIGIKKALGAKRYMILLEFLIESVILCIVGGVFGLALVFIAMFALSYGLTSFEFVLSLNNILLGLGLSIFIGILAGMIPASQASKMDAVVAMRQ
jgi:putative ABC transport system permease protein